MSAKTYFLFVIIFVLFVAVVLLLFSLLRPSQENTGPSPQQVIPTRLPPNLIYPTNTIEKQVEKLTKRKPLSMSDQEVKAKMLAPLGNQSGTVANTRSYTIKYLKPFDNFEVEILSTEIERTKDEATAYLISFGFSAEGICNLPVMFFLNWEVKQKLSANTPFDPLPKGCS